MPHRSATQHRLSFRCAAARYSVGYEAVQNRDSTHAEIIDVIENPGVRARVLWSTQPVAQDATSPPPRVQPVPAPPPDYTVWHGVLGMIAPTNSNLTINRGTYGNTLIVGSQTVADLQWLYLPLAAPDNVKIKSITLCYSVDNARSFVSQIRLIRETVPPNATVVHDDGTDLDQHRRNMCGKQRRQLPGEWRGHCWAAAELRQHRRSHSHRRNRREVRLLIVARDVGRLAARYRIASHQSDVAAGRRGL